VHGTEVSRRRRIHDISSQDILDSHVAPHRLSPGRKRKQVVPRAPSLCKSTCSIHYCSRLNLNTFLILFFPFPGEIPLSISIGASFVFFVVKVDGDKAGVGRGDPLRVFPWVEIKGNSICQARDSFRMNKRTKGLMPHIPVGTFGRKLPALPAPNTNFNYDNSIVTTRVSR